MKSFGVSGNNFEYGGDSIQLISGAVHYFRVVPEYWKDRLLKLKACGFNAVETYLPWNLHEPAPGKFCFEGNLDVVHFVRIARALGLLVILRPSPYICAELDFGGLPAWLLADPSLRVRCMYPGYIAAIDRYYDTLLPMLAPLQCTQGGPVIAMQIENEYGSYGSDKEYLRYLEDGMRLRGIDVLLFTSDGPTDSMLLGGTLRHILKTGNFGSDAGSNLKKLRQYQPEGPLMCMEFWNGWFDSWGREHVTREAQDAAACMDDMLSAGASMNCYMFHGGTNFGFTNGANYHDGGYHPIATNYDYDAPLDESGDPTAKFHAFRSVAARHGNPVEMPAPCPGRKEAFGTVALTEQASLGESLHKLTSPIRRPYPEAMEMLGQSYGFILYRTHISGPRESAPLVIQELRDRAHVFVNGALHGIQYRNDADPEAMHLEIPPEGIELDILVENMGRVNFGSHLMERKGITYGVRHGFQFLSDWEIFGLPLDDLSSLDYRAPFKSDIPSFHRGLLDISSPADTFVKIAGSDKGVCFVNGFNLGRYWNMEPHRNLYLPAPLLKTGVNEFVVFDLQGKDADLTLDLVAGAV